MDSDEDFPDDPSFDWTDPALDTIQPSAPVSAPTPPVPAPPPKPPLPQKRPLVPPVRQPAGPIIRPAQPPPAKRQRVDVDPNPFARRPPPPPVVVQDEDEDLPEISVTEKGYSMAVPLGGTVGRSAPMGPPPAVPTQKAVHPVRVPPPPKAPPVVPPPPPAVQKNAEQLKELEVLRLTNSTLQSQLVSKTGEVAVVRRRLEKTEAEAAAQREVDKKVRRSLEARLEEKEKEHKAALGRMQVEIAFKRQELETSARRPTSSHWSSARRNVGTSQQVGGSMGPPPLPSPSVGRGGRAQLQAGTTSARPAPAPGFAGFKNAFESSPIPVQKIDNNKGKQKMLVDDDGAEDDGDFSHGGIDSRGVRSWKDGGGARAGDLGVEMELEDGVVEEELDIEARDARAEILATLLNHTTWTPLTSASASATPSATSLTRLSSIARSSTSTALASTSGALHPPTTSVSSSPSVSPIPTFQALTNLALPHPYDTLCRTLFTTLSRSSATLPATLATTLLDLASLFESKALIAPLSALLSLLSELILHPSLASLLLPILPLLTRVLAKFGRPTSMAKKSEKDGRRRRKVVKRLTDATADGEGAEAERVALPPELRNPLLFAVLGVLESAAWRSGDSFVNFLASSGTAVGTLLDPRHPRAVLRASGRLFALLASRPSLFHVLLALPIEPPSPPIFIDHLSRLIHLAPPTPLLATVTSLAVSHPDAGVLLGGSGAVIPECLEVLFRAVRDVWEGDGREVSRAGRKNLSLVLRRLETSVHLFHHLAANLNLAEFFVHSVYQGLHERFTVAFGRLAFGTMPEWCGEAEGRVMVELSYLAQEIMEDVSPQEAEEIENCFGAFLEGEQGEDEDEERVLLEVDAGAP